MARKRLPLLSCAASIYASTAAFTHLGTGIVRMCRPFPMRSASTQCSSRSSRYLVEEKGVSPNAIAIYADLTFHKGGKPDFVNVFSKKESDFDEFQAGNYQDIIFNLALQEGWDDPACYLAYIDKSMGSNIQVQQIIGRVLRQYGAVHYGGPLLDSAHFFLRVDKESVFPMRFRRSKQS